MVRLRFTNGYGSEPVELAAVTIGRRAVGPSLASDAVATVRFGGAGRVVIPVGAEILSDRVAIDVEPFRELAVSVYLRDVVRRPTEHFITRQTSYATAPGDGDQTGNRQGLGFAATRTAWSNGWAFLSGMDVVAPGRTNAVVTVGDSITDGFEGKGNAGVESFEGVNRNGRYPDFLQRRLISEGMPISVVNAGLSGNNLLTASGPDALIPGGPSVLDRLRADAFRVAGATHVLVLGGINDLAAGASSSQVVAGLERITERIRARGFRPLLGTLTPTGGAVGFGNYGAPGIETARQQINSWIRSRSREVAVFDFDAAIRDPGQPTRLAPRFDSSDHVHPNRAGYRAMAETVRLRTLRARCRAL